MYEVSALRKVIVSAVVTAAVAGLGVLAANLSGQVDVTTYQGLVLSGIVMGIKAVQKLLAPVSNVTRVDSVGGK